MSALSTLCDQASEQHADKPFRLKDFVSSLQREIRIRRALREVRALDDAMLHDIGISPGSIEDAVRCGRR